MTQLKPGDLLHDRYTLRRIIGRGGQGTTWLAVDRDKREVAIKHLTLDAAADWKAVELFEREGAVLRQLDHPGIPRTIDALRDEEPALRLLLVQEFVPGDTIAQRLATGERWDEARLHSFLLEALDILIYLGEQRPPIIHRDIKPGNLIIRPDGRLALIDFGGVLADMQAPTGGSTVVGTTGYMPPEQLMGRATCASDLYALGATAIHMHTGRDPSSLPVERMRLRYHDHAHLSPGMTALLDKLTDPTPEDRFQSAAEAREALLAPVKVIKTFSFTKGLVREGIWGLAHLIAPLVAIISLTGSLTIISLLVDAPSERKETVPITFDDAGSEIACEQLYGHGILPQDSVAAGDDSYTLYCTIHNTSATYDVFTLGAQVQLFGAQDALLGGRPWGLWNNEAGPLRPGERITTRIQLLKQEEALTRAALTIDQVTRRPATPAAPLIAVEIAYETPIPKGVALTFSNMELVLPDRALRRYTTHLRMHVKNTGDVNAGTVEVRLESQDAAGEALETKKPFLNFGVALRPDVEEVRTLSIPEGTTKVRLVVVRLEQASSR
jgi:hypothetical protein